MSWPTVVSEDVSDCLHVEGLVLTVEEAVFACRLLDSPAPGVHEQALLLRRSALFSLALLHRLFLGTHLDRGGGIADAQRRDCRSRSGECIGTVSEERGRS